ncbi:MAG: type II secretion system F family protein [Verrucomicrobiaceae bacterium]|nr:type II secretion system F family protein [Verrucomicrobiaceae bacterium]
MPTFAYSAHGPSGVVNGELTAGDRADAFAQLSKKRLQPFKLEAKGATTAANATKARPEAVHTGQIKLKLNQVVLFTEELSDLLAAGIQLEPALATMERRKELSGLKTLAAALRTKVRDGMSFSKAVAATTPSFGSLFCAVAAAGEASGAMPTILKRQAEYMRGLQALRSKVMGALIYPAFLIVAALGVSALFVLYLIPKLTEMLDSTGGSLPMAAQVILSLSDLVKAYWWVLAIIGITIFILFKAWVSRPSSAIPYSKMQLRLPVFGPVLSSRFYVQFMETLANLVGNGLPMMNAMQLTQQATDNAFLRSELDPVIRNVGEGVALSRALDRSGHFPPLLIDIVSVGEQTGKLSEALQKGAERFDRELAKRVERMTAMIQPLIVFLMAGMVGTMAYLMITAIFQTISGMNR